MTGKQQNASFETSPTPVPPSRRQEIIAYLARGDESAAMRIMLQDAEARLLPIMDDLSAELVRCTAEQAEERLQSAFAAALSGLAT